MQQIISNCCSFILCFWEALCNAGFAKCYKNRLYYFLFRLGTHVSVPFRINFCFVGITTGYVSWAYFLNFLANRSLWKGVLCIKCFSEMEQNKAHGKEKEDKSNKLRGGFLLTCNLKLEGSRGDYYANCLVGSRKKKSNTKWERYWFTHIKVNVLNMFLKETLKNAHKVTLLCIYGSNVVWAADCSHFIIKSILKKQHKHVFDLCSTILLLIFPIFQEAVWLFGVKIMFPA